MNIKKNIFLSLLISLFFCLNANATKLPNDVWQYVRTYLPSAQQRFDSVIIVNDDVMYIPLTPAINKTVNEILIEYVYPANQTLEQLPEVVLLNNGYSLLKVFKDNTDNYSLTKKDDLPIKVRLGLMPQDMLTPIGLKMPESLKLTLGDLLIPSKEENSLILNENEKEKASIYSPTVKRNEFIYAVELKNKKVFVNPKNSKFLEVYDGTSQTPLYELKLSSMPLKIITSEQSNVALVLYWSGKIAEIIDLKDERVIAQIELDANATDVTLNKKDNIAYITSQNANKIYLVDLNSMQLSRVIKLDQKPSKISYCSEDNNIAFFDEYSSKIFNITQNGDEYSVQPMGAVENVSKVLCDVKNIYALSRTQNELYIYDKIHGKLISTTELDKKPTDGIIYDSKIYIICAKEGYMNVYDILENKIISRVQLSKEGFYSNITLIPSDNNILITGINSKSYLLYNLDTMKLVKKQESYVDVANIILTNKSQRL